MGNKKYLNMVFMVMLGYSYSCGAHDSYVGIQYGVLSSAEANIGSAGLLLAWEFNEAYSLEGKYIFTIEEHEFRPRNTLSSDSVAIFGALKSKGKIYSKVKLGYSEVNFERTVYGNTISGDTDGFTVGYSWGAEIWNGSIELEYISFPVLTGFPGASSKIVNNLISLGYSAHY